MQRSLVFGLCAFLVSSPASAQMNASDLKWGPAPPSLPPGAELAVLSGDPSKEGMFTMRVRFPAGFTVQPHHHPADELVTVIEGDFALGMGDTFDKSKMTQLKQGGYAVAAKTMNHYVTSASGGTVQITSMGPFQIIYANPKDDPRNNKTRNIVRGKE
jgi:quercetin dioxygenase-like cupin family protein